MNQVHITIHPVITFDQQRAALEALQLALIEAHRRGEHPYGLMRRECPLCQR